MSMVRGAAKANDWPISPLMSPSFRGCEAEPGIQSAEVEGRVVGLRLARLPVLDRLYSYCHRQSSGFRVLLRSPGMTVWQRGRSARHHWLAIHLVLR